MFHRNKTYNLRTAKGRFQAATEGVRGYVVYTSCTSKRRYPTENEAGKYARRYSLRYSKPERPYYCQFCNGYHLTSKPRPSSLAA